MKLLKLIKGQEIDTVDPIKRKAFSVGSKLQWGNKVWEVIESDDDCTGCYFRLNGRCYRCGIWIYELGECSYIVRADGKDIAFKLMNS